MSFFRTADDAEAGNDPAQLATVAWQAMPGEMNMGYGRDVVWLKMRVRRDAAAPADWVLNLANALLDDVRVFQHDPDGTWTRQQAGEDFDRGAWPLDARNASFPLTLPSGETMLLIRIKTQNAFSSAIHLWQRDAFDNASRRESLYYGLYFGGFLLLLILHGFFWRLTRERQSGWYLLYLTLTAVIQSLTLGIPQWTLRLPVALSDPLLGFCICIALIVGTRFAMLQLDLTAVYPRLGRLFMGFITLVSLPSAALIVAGHYGTGITFVQLATLVELVTMTGIAGWLLYKGHRPAQFFAFAFGIYYAAVSISFLRNLAVLPSNAFTNNVISLGTLIHMLAMSMRLHFQFDVLRRQASEARERAMQGLEAEVAVRTADLQQEIERRILLESELREALATEQRLKEEQRSFVAMVSHEFRTPLAIINVTAQQIARNADAAWSEVESRCRNLRDTVRRMLDLVDNYLAVERMDAPVFSLRPCNLTELIRELAQQWPQGRVVASLRNVPESFSCDPGLLKIALHNLLSNADRHAPAAESIAIDAQAGADGLRIDVSNGGEPIPPEEAHLLFQKYFRGRRAQHRTGAGLGLHLVRQIADMHGGRAWLENTGGENWITFSLFIPGQKPAD